ncbi:hypothetical protein M0R45_006163 [Rubus argutus]|uniref:DUF4283 domain-containing protein n=1 Tax=Rubus argutus TaxID=59490 RepID=A0AAW1YPR2_RUBAR
MVDEVSARLAASLAISENGKVRFGAGGSAALSQHHYEGDPWFFGKATVVLASYGGLGDPTKVELTSFPIWVHIIGFPPALVTAEAALLVGETPGSVLQVDKVEICRGDLVRVCIHHVLTNPVKQAFPPIEFEFFPGVVALLRFHYDHVIGFCKTCDLLEHEESCCGGVLAATVGEAWDLLVLMALFSRRSFRQGVVPPAPLLFSIPGYSVASLALQAQLLRQPLFGSAVTTISPPVVSFEPLHSLAMCSPPRLIGQKGKAPLALITAGKRGRVLDLVPSSSLMDEDLELYLPSKVGALVVSPLKRKCGRPVGSKNRPKGARGVKRNLSVALVGATFWDWYGC